MDLPTLLQMSKQKVIQKGIQVTMAVPAPSQETVAKCFSYRQFHAFPHGSTNLWSLP